MVFYQEFLLVDLFVVILAQTAPNFSAAELHNLLNSQKV